MRMPQPQRADNCQMVRPDPDHIIVIGAGAAGLMAARELGRAGKKVTIVCTENLNSDVVMVKPAEDRV
jgi:ribulose 1,5-bisphosphate synthetase/thiazole synthase